MSFTTLPQMRLRGADPAFEVSASNLRFVLGEVSGGPASVSLRQGQNPQASAAFLHVAQAPWPQGLYTALSVTDEASAPETLWNTPTLSVRTWADVEEARVDGAGVSCRSLTAGVFTNLVSDYVSDNAMLPPSAAALSSAYIALSNMVVLGSAGLFSNGLPGGSNGRPLVDSYTSASVLSAPTANALRAAYVNLDNKLAVSTHSLTASVPMLVRSAVVSVLQTALLSNTTTASSTTTQTIPATSNGGPTTYVNNVTNTTTINVAMDGSPFAFSNDVFVTSIPDNQPRALYQELGATVAAAPGIGSVCAFRWFASDMGADLMTMTARGDLWLSGGVSANGDVAVGGSCSVGGELTVGSVLRVTPDAVGVNLPPGVAPLATLHVIGTILSTEQQFALSDKSVKTDIRPIPHAAQKVMRIRGCSYLRTDLGPDAPEGRTRQVGVIAQEVHSVLPEAVQVGADGRMSVAYGNLVALALEAIREISLEQMRMSQCIRKLERMRGHARGGAAPRVCVAAFSRRACKQRGVG